MRKLITPVVLLILSGVVLTLSTLAKRDIVSGLGFRPPRTIEWNERFPHYMRIRNLLPSKWDAYPKLFEKCFLDQPLATTSMDKETLERYKSALVLSFMTGEMQQYLAARQFEAIIVIILSAWWMAWIIRRNKIFAAPSVPGTRHKVSGPLNRDIQ